MPSTRGAIEIVRRTPYLVTILGAGRGAPFSDVRSRGHVIRVYSSLSVNTTVRGVVLATADCKLNAL